jgi:hypothetical protein
MPYGQPTLPQAADSRTKPMQREENGVRRDWLATRRQELLDRIQKDGHCRCPIRPCGAERFDRETRPVG